MGMNQNLSFIIVPGKFDHDLTATKAWNPGL